MEEKQLNNKIYTATKWSVITNVTRKLISPVTNMIMARLLAPDAFGVVATINMVVSFAEVFTDAGFQKFLVQHEYDDEKSLYKSANVAFWTNFCLSSLIWLIIFFCRNLLAKAVGSEGYGFHLAVAALAIPLVAFSSIQQALFRRNFDFKGLFTARLINSLIPLVVTIPLAYYTRSCWAIIIGTLASNFSDALILTIKSKWKPKLTYSFFELERMLSFSFWTILESISIWLTVNVDVFIIGRSLSSHYLGMYKTSIVTVQQITALITTTVLPVLFSALSRVQDDDRLFKKTLFSFQNKCAYLLVPMSIGIFLYRDVTTWILLGDQWMEAAQFIGYIGLLQAFSVLISNFASEVYRSKGQPIVSFLLQVAYILILIPSLFLGTKFSFQILCRIRALLLLLFCVMHLCVMQLKYKINAGSVFKQMYGPFLASVVMGVFAIIIRGFCKSMTSLALSILPCIIIYFFACMAFPCTRGIMLETVASIKKSFLKK